MNLGFSLFGLLLFCVQANANESLSYSGRLVQTNGAPVTGTVALRAELAYTNSLGTILCSDDIAGVVLSKGVFHVKLDFACTGGKTLTQVLSQAPANESVAIQITDVTNSKSYSFQAIHAIPYANVARVAVQLEQNGAGDGEFLKWDNTAKEWKPGTVSGASGGTVTSVSASGPLSVSTPTSTPAISIAQANTTTSGYLSAADWNSFNSKQGSIAAGTTAQYYRGDKSWQTLDSSVVPENVNLYFTNARALGVPLTGFVSAAGAIVATDTTLAAFEKAQGQINAINSAANNFLIKNSTDTVTGVVNVGTTGLLQLAYVPVGMNDAVNKSYADTKLNLTGGTLSGVLTVDDDLRLKGGSNHVTVKGHASSADYNLVLPSGAGANGQFLQTDGSGNLSWVAQSSSAIPSGAAGGDLAGTYPNPTVPGLAGKISSVLTNGNILVGNGSNVATGVAVSGDAILSNAGVLTLANTAVTTGTYKSVTVDGKGRVTAGSNPTTLAGYGITDTLVTGVTVTAPVTNTGTAAVPLIGMPAATGAVDGYLTSTNFTTFNNKQNAITSASNLSTGTLTTGELRLNELAVNGTDYTGFKSPNALAANVIYTLPTADGSSGQVLSTNASGVLSWTSIPSSMAPNGSAGGGLTGSYPNPTIASGLDAVKLSAGSVSNTEFDYLDGVTSSIQAQINGKQASDTGLTNFAAFNTSGIIVQTANDTFAGRSIAGTTNRLTVTNGDGVSGNPTINIPIALLPSPIAGDAGKFLKASGADTSAWSFLSSSDITGALGFTPINKAGDTISTGTIGFNAIGTLSLAYTPTNATDATSKSYVDNAIATAANQWTLGSGNVYRTSGNVGVGTSSPAALFDVESTTTHSGLRVGATGTNNSYIDFYNAGAKKANLYWNGTTSTLQLNDIGTSDTVLNGTGGRVGIGISPTETLQVNGTFKAGSGSNYFKYNGAADITFSYPARGSGGRALVHDAGNTQVLNYNGDFTGGVRIDGAGPTPNLFVSGAANGFVGIGTSSPATLLHLSSPTSAYQTIERPAGGFGIIQLSTAGSGRRWEMGVDNSAESGSNVGSNFGLWKYSDGGTQSQIIAVNRATGNVGIGTTSPTSVLTIDGGAGVLALKPGALDHTYMQFFARTATPAVRSGYIGFPGAASTNLNLYNEIAGGNIVLMPIGGGNVGIGTTSPSQLLTVNGGAEINSIIGGRTNGSGNFHLDAWGSGADRSVYLNWASGIGGSRFGNGFANYGPAFAASFNVTSDRRLKDNIKPIDHALKKILQLDGVTFNWKDEKRNELEGQKIGVIAQEVEKVFPQAVRLDHGENALPGGTRVVSYPDLVSPLIAAVKEFYSFWFHDSQNLHEIVNRQSREIASIKSENASKDKEIAELKARMERIEKVLKSKEK
jgi:hypothetical protein